MSQPSPHIPLETIDESGGVPVSRLVDAAKAQTVFTQMNSAHEEQNKSDATVTNMLDGEPPMDATELEEAGQNWRANFNSRIGEAFVAQGEAPYQDVIFSSPSMCTVTLKASPDPKQNEEWGQGVTAAFEKFNRADKQLSYMFMRSQRDMVAFRYGPVFWPDPLYYQALPIPQENLLVMKATEANLDRWPLCAIKFDETVHGLHAYIADPKAAKAGGWNLSATRKAILQAAPKNLTGGKTDWMAFARSLRSNDLFYSSVSETIPLVWMLWQEFAQKGEKTGRISMGLLTQASEVQDWLYRKVGVYKDWHQAIVPFYFDIGNGDHHSVKGLGIKALSLLTAYNRMMCDQVDHAKFATAMHWQARESTDMQKLSVVPMGPYFIHPFGLDLQQVPNMSSGLEASQLIKNDLLGTATSNLVQYRQNLQRQMAGQKGNPPTAAQIEYQAENETMIGRPQMLRYFEQLDWFFEERLRRLVNPILTEASRGWSEINEFRQECAKNGVPLEAISRVDTVKATRTVGYGSPNARQGALTRMMEFRPAYDEEGQRTILEDWTASQVGHVNMRRYIQPPQRMAPDEEDQIERARVQVGLMRGGNQPVITSSQNPAIFAKTYLAAGVAVINDMKKGAAPAKVYEFLQLLGPAALAHIQRLAQDPQRKPMVQQMMKQLQAMEKFSKRIGQGLQKEMQAKAQQGQQMMQRGAEQQADFVLKAQELKAKEALAEEKTRHGMALKSATTAQKMDLADKTTANKIRNQRLEAAAKPKEDSGE